MAEEQITIASLEKELAEMKTQQVQDEKDAENARLRARVEQLEADEEIRKVQAAEKLAAANQRIAASMAKEKGASANVIQTELARDKAVKACGSIAAFNQLPLATRLASYGIPEEAASIPEKEIRTYFGSTSSSIEAARLHRQDPKRYALLRALYRERGLK